MVNYGNGKIYAIRSFKTDEIYIGSTTQKLCQRLQKHKTTKKLYEKGKHHYYTSFKILEYDDAYIELIEKYPCNCKEELLKKEGEYMREMLSVNKNIAGRTNKEYYEENKEIINKRIKEYYEKNKEHLAKQKKEYREEHKEQLKQKKKEYIKKNIDFVKQFKKAYYEKNKEAINQKRKEKVKCPQCEKELRKDSIARHIKNIH